MKPDVNISGRRTISISLYNEFKSLVGNWNESELDRDNVYFELIFDEEDFRCYFMIVGGNK